MPQPHRARARDEQVGRAGPRRLSERTLRWSELRRQVEGVSEKMLAQTLQTLEGDGLVHREAHPVIPPHVDYSLTPLGRDLVARLIPLLTWIGAHADEILSGKTTARS